MIDAAGIASALNVPCIISGRMHEAMNIWENAYTDKSSWLTKRIRSMRLPSTIARELKRLTLTEISISANNETLDKYMQQTVKLLRRKLDYGIAMGGMILKPCYTRNGIRTDIAPQGCYIPINYTDDFCDAVICPEEIVMGSKVYTRLECHNYDREKCTHTIENHCYCSAIAGTLGTECSLAEVPAWADILPKKVFEGAEKPLFAVFRMPDANHIDTLSPLGVSAYADAIDFIRDADEQWERILWELESSERAIDASEDLFRMNPLDGKPVLPKGRERMYHCLERTGTDNSIYNTFSPEIRDKAQFGSLNQMLRRIENAVGLSYGTLSEVSDVEKTAEEIISSKQRSYARVGDIQQSLNEALESLLYGMQYYRDYYTGISNPAVQMNITFGDGVLENVKEEFQRRSHMTQAGYLRPELMLSWYFGCDEESAKKMMPPASSGYRDLFGGDE